MEIIKKGKLPDDIAYKGECHYCGTIVRFKRSEGHVVYDQRDGNSVSVCCPLCHNNIYVSL